MRSELRKKTDKFTLTMIICAIIIAIILLSSLLTALILYVAVRTGLVSLFFRDGVPPGAMLFLSSLAVVILGIIITSTLGRVPLRPVKKLVKQMNKLSSGDFSVRLDFGPPLGDHPAVKEISDSFNKMAAELGNTEILRRDFVNDFSHEFKTPIVSIAGFAKLLRQKDLDEKTRDEYLGIIEEESLRLSAMATNVLNLSKIESQNILTDKKVYNLSEQLRSAILLFEPKWTKKNVELSLDIDEHEIEANEPLLLQVWINLFDNALKFSPEGGTVEIATGESDGHVFVSFRNAGAPIPEDEMPKIFNKFYKGERSHSGEGNGIGLSLVKKIVELHSGTIEVKSDGTGTVFCVKLPGRGRQVIE